MPFAWLRSASPARVLLTVGAPAAVLLAVLYLRLVRTEPGQVLDERLFGKLVDLGPQAHLVAPLLRAGVPVLLAGSAAALMLQALTEKRRRAVVGSVLLVACSAPISIVLRDVVFHRPALGVSGYSQNTLPSTHVTLTLALCAAVLVLWPPHTERWATGILVASVVVAALASAMGSVVSYAHRPGDVVASFLVVATTGAVVTASVPRSGRPVRR